MNSKIRIQMMDHFEIFINEQSKANIAQKTPKGAALMQILIANRDVSVPNSQLISLLWDKEKSINPENAQKTLISRIRTILNEMYPDLGKCIVSERGSYRWRPLPEMEIDLYRIEECFEIIDQYDVSVTEEKQIEAYKTLITLYKGDLLQKAEINDWAIEQAKALHDHYLTAVNRYIALLKEKGEYNEIITVARTALDVDNFDDRIQLELMNALLNTNRTNDALTQYKHAMQMNYRYLGVQPSDDMLEFYKELTERDHSLELTIENIRQELLENNKQKKAFYCDYGVFKEIYSLQMRNLERLGTAVFLGMIRLGSQDGSAMDTIRLDNTVTVLIDILRNNLRKGDTISKYSPDTCAILLPSVNYAAGTMVMERLKNEFYRQFPSSDITFSYRLVPLTAE